MAVGDACVSWLSHTSTNTTFLSKATDYFSHASAEVRGKKKSRLNRGSNSQPPGHESDTLTTEPPGWGETRSQQISFLSTTQLGVFTTLRRKAFDIIEGKEKNTCSQHFLLCSQCFLLQKRQKLSFYLPISGRL